MKEYLLQKKNISILLIGYLVINLFNCTPNNYLKKQQDLHQQQKTKESVTSKLEKSTKKLEKNSKLSDIFYLEFDDRSFLKLNEDGTFLLSEKGKNGTGKYKINGNTIILIVGRNKIKGKINKNVITDPDGMNWIKKINIVKASGIYYLEFDDRSFLKLNEDGTFLLSEKGKNGAGKYEIIENTIILIVGRNKIKGKINENIITDPDGKNWIKN